MGSDSDDWTPAMAMAKDDVQMDVPSSFVDDVIPEESEPSFRDESPAVIALLSDKMDISREPSRCPSMEELPVFEKSHQSAQKYIYVGIAAGAILLICWKLCKR